MADLRAREQRWRLVREQLLRDLQTMRRRLQRADQRTLEARAAGRAECGGCGAHRTYVVPSYRSHAKPKYECHETVQTLSTLPKPSFGILHPLHSSPNRQAAAAERATLEETEAQLASSRAARARIQELHDRDIALALGVVHEVPGEEGGGRCFSEPCAASSGVEAHCDD